MFRSSKVIKFRFDGRTQWQIFLLLYGHHQHGVSKKKLSKFGWNTFPNNARINNRTDPNLGEGFYISIIFHIPSSWLYLLNGLYDFYFRWRDTANQPLIILDWIFTLNSTSMILIRKTLGARTRTNNKLNPTVTPGLGFEPGSHWWEASAITTAPSLLPCFSAGAFRWGNWPL